MDEKLFTVDNVLTILRYAAEHVYKCDVCGEIILPQVTVDAAQVNITSECQSITGGVGNKVLVKHVCNKCRENMTIGFIPTKPISWNV